MSKFLSFLFLSATLSVACAQTGSPTTCSQMGLGQGASLNGFVPFPKADPFNEDISTVAVDPGSSAIIATLGSTGLHPDFGSGTYAGETIGIPYEVVGSQALVNIGYTAYGNQSDPGPMPIPANAPVESGSDHHVLVLSESNCFLYELDEAALQSDGTWNADSGAVWDLLDDNARPYTWTSADAAGLPIFPGLARYDEVASGAINHALRFTVAHTRDAFIAPATHQSSSSTSASYPPMGARFRLKASYDISSFTPQAKVILQAMKTYGMIVADNGSNMFVSGAPNSGWDNDDLHNLGKVPASAFEVVSTGTAYTNTTAPTGPAPVIEKLNSKAKIVTKTVGRDGHKSTSKEEVDDPVSVPSGTRVTLKWKATGASYYVLTPGIGAVRGDSAVVNPTQTTTYTLYANSHFGSTTRTITITVQ